MSVAHKTDAPAVPDARADDEKTIHAEREYSDKKDVEGARPSSLASSEGVRCSEANQDAEFALEDDFPDGGLKAWTVVAGVSIYPAKVGCPLFPYLTPHVQASLGTFATFGFVNAWGVRVSRPFL